MDAGLGDELDHDLIQFAIFPAGKNVFVDSREMAIRLAVQAEACVSTPNICCQNHFSKFLHRRPSRSMSSSESFGPQTPAG